MTMKTNHPQNPHNRVKPIQSVSDMPIQDKIAVISKKLYAAYSIGNNYAAQQLQTILDDLRLQLEEENIMKAMEKETSSPVIIDTGIDITKN